MTCLGSGMPFDGVCDSPSSSRCGVIAKQLVTSSLRLLDGGSPSTGSTKLAPALLGLPSVMGAKFLVLFVCRDSLLVLLFSVTSCVCCVGYYLLYRLCCISTLSIMKMVQAGVSQRSTVKKSSSGRRTRQCPVPGACRVYSDACSFPACTCVNDGVGCCCSQYSKLLRLATRTQPPACNVTLASATAFGAFGILWCLGMYV